jgi:hypothetical protein
LLLVAPWGFSLISTHDASKIQIVDTGAAVDDELILMVFTLVMLAY